MKKMFILLAFMLTISISYAFIGNVEKTNEKAIIEASKKSEINSDKNVDYFAACCTVSDGHYEATYCDEGGNYRRACRKARRALKKELEEAVHPVD